MPVEYPSLKVESPNVKYGVNDKGEPQIESIFEYDHVQVEKEPGFIKATPMKTQMTFRTQLRVPRVGLMLVGLGGNNGTTVTGAILANKHKMSFQTKDGLVMANYFGSVTQSSTVFVGSSSQEDFHLPMNKLLPMVDPNELIIDGWDISSMNLADAMKRAKVIDIDLQRQLVPLMQHIKPRKALFDGDFVAANQAERADNIIDPKLTKWEQVQQIMADIEDFKVSQELDKCIVLWTANTERFCDILPGVHDSSANLLQTLRNNAPGCKEISPSSLYAIASILSGCTYINGSPQNTFVPGLIELAEERSIYIGGDDFKSGQTKFKSVLVDFLVNAGIKPCSIVSYNHLGNNDGYNLSAPQQFRSKEISKSSVVDDMVASNQILFGQGLAKPDHTVVIKHVPFVADSKRALDEYISELMLGGRHTLTSHNTCEDSLLAAPLIIDLVLLAELCDRITFKVHRPLDGAVEVQQFQRFNSVLSVLAYLCKAPLVERGAKVVNALFKQRSCIENLLRALIALPPINHMDFQHKLSIRQQWHARVARVQPIEQADNEVASESEPICNLVELSPEQTQFKSKLAAGAGAGGVAAVPKSASGY